MVKWKYSTLPKAVDLSGQDLLWDDLVLPLGFGPIIKRRFITPIRKNRALNDHSAIIFGPPGTGKTSLLKAIAKQLGYELFLIGPQDLIGGSGESLESTMHTCVKEIESLVRETGQ